MPKKVSTEILKYNNQKLLNNIGGGVVDFTSNDSTSATSFTSVDTLTTKSTLSSLFNKVSTMFKNIRYLYSKVTTIESDLNTNISKIPQLVTVGTGAGLVTTNSNSPIITFNLKKGINLVYVSVAEKTGGVSVGDFVFDTDPTKWCILNTWYRFTVHDSTDMQVVIKSGTSAATTYNGLAVLILNFSLD